MLPSKADTSASPPTRRLAQSNLTLGEPREWTNFRQPLLPMDWCDNIRFSYPHLVTLKRPLFVGRDERWFLPAGPSSNGRRAEVTALVTGDHHDGRTDRFKRCPKS